MNWIFHYLFLTFVPQISKKTSEFDSFLFLMREDSQKYVYRGGLAGLAGLAG